MKRLQDKKDQKYLAKIQSKMILGTGGDHRAHRTSTEVPTKHRENTHSQEEEQASEP
ncbi:ATP-dependent DNA-helicase PcrA [Sesbania bispinosa]|nr:ATP-dependent DNA-helicase PcrA [Sesbania bispinosa]